MTDTKPRGKGRPTPKRSEAVAKRRQPVVSTRGGATRGAARLDKAERAELRKKMREALRTGDERYYPAVAAGPERALVRDVVDARKAFGWLAIPGWFLGLAMSMVPTVPTQVAGSLLMPMVLVILVADSVAAGRAVRRALEARWPEGTKDSRKSLVWYGVARNTQFRRMRLPRPRVERGAPVA